MFLINNYLSFSQTTPVSGVVNTYHHVVEIIPVKACIRVSSTAGLSINKRVMIIQMKGAAINTVNNSSFGDTTALNEAGNYEIGTICAIRPDSVFLYHTLLNSYTPATNKVQLVQVAEYYSANVIDTVKASPWNNTTGTGGVIAIFCDEDLTLNETIYADSGGYRGGTFAASNGSCTNIFPANGYIYDASSLSPQNGAYKGESAVDVTTGQSGGRGAPANGGGGGNNHNNSGGGGANLNDGGRGGGNSSTAGCTTTLRGEAGKALSSWNGEKIFLGGGGGSGHSNGAIYTKGGGNGGGIIFIRANNLIGNGYKISANAGNGGQSLSDGAGGGGAAGTIIADITNYTGAVSIQANGGNGGNSDDGGTSGRCYGGGGGGSGGVIYYSGTTPAITTTVNGGTAGTETGRSPSCAAPVAALNGSNGQIIENYPYRRSTDPAAYCGILLPAKLYYFKASLLQRTVILQWRILNPELIQSFVVEKLNGNNEWFELSMINAIDNREAYSGVDQIPLQGKNLYRLKIIEKNNSVSYSAIQQITISFYETDFSIFPNPARNSITISGNLNGIHHMKLTDLSGRIILQKNISNTRSVISLPYLSPGVYLVQIGQTVKKLIIR